MFNYCNIFVICVDHNDIKAIPQEPYVFGQQFVDMTKRVLAHRYSLLNYYYTLFYNVHVNGGGVVKPLFYVFGKKDSNPILASIDSQFMVGNSLMVSPVLTEGATAVKAYIPVHPSGWFDFASGELISLKGGEFKTFSQPLYGQVNTQVVGGSIIQQQVPGLTTFETRRNPFELTITLCQHEFKAHGEIFIDDGVTANSIENGAFSLVTVKAAPIKTNGNIGLQTVTSHQGFIPQNAANKIQTLTFYGFEVSQPASCSVVVNARQVNSFTVDVAKRVIRINNLDLGLFDNNMVAVLCDQ